MKIKSLARVVAVCGGFIAANALADAIDITVDSSGNLYNVTGFANATQYGQGDNNPASNLAFLNIEIGNWNSAFDPDLSLASGPVALNLEDLTGSSYTSVAGYNYVVFHFGAGPATPKSPSGYWEAFYLGGTGGDVFGVPTLNGASIGGFSSARYFGAVSVPDGGNTLLMLGAGTLGLAASWRRWRRWCR